jgi:hypothetical protein
MPALTAPALLPGANHEGISTDSLKTPAQSLVLGLFDELDLEFIVLLGHKITI